MDGAKGRISDKEIMHCANVAVWDCSSKGACRVRGKEEWLLSVVAFEVGRRPAVSTLQM